MISTREANAAAAENAVQVFVPEFRRRAKSDSAFMRFLGTVLGWFGNKTFMEDFSTTIGYTAYLTEDHMNRIGVIFHEGRHAYQNKKYTRLGFGALYLFPQLIGGFAAIASLTLLVYSLTGFTWAWWPVAGLSLLALPLPAYWRMKFEVDAYGVSMAVRHWSGGTVDDAYIDRMIRNFVGGNYYFMWPFRGYLRTRFRRKLAWIKSPKVADDLYYMRVHRLLEERGLLRTRVA